MGPSRRRGVSKASSAAAAAAARRQWKVGDLVLAKVKGFPAWPATVSEPKKWGYSTDWKKVLVYFFGTKQIHVFCEGLVKSDPVGSVPYYAQEKSTSSRILEQRIDNLREYNMIRHSNRNPECLDEKSMKDGDLTSSGTLGEENGNHLAFFGKDEKSPMGFMYLMGSELYDKK